jgi:hypothetical protein
MPKIVSKVLFALIIIALLFIILVWFHNSTLLTVTLSSKPAKKIAPELYYAGEHEVFSEDKKITPKTLKSGQLLFSLPQFDTIRLLRFDPAKQAIALEMSAMTLVVKHWFKETHYKIPFTYYTPLDQIESYRLKSNKVTFKTVGDDAKIALTLPPKEVSASVVWHADYFMVALIGYLILLSLFRLYKTETFDTVLTMKLMLYGLFFALSIFKVVYYKENVRFHQPPDELAHLSYIAHVQTHDEMIPKYEESYILNQPKVGNYLSHPPLYYHLMHLVHNDNFSFRYNAGNFRDLSATLFILSYFILLLLMFNAKVSLLTHLVYLTVITSIPMYAYLGGAITNDTLGMLGGALFFYALQKLIREEYTNTTYFLLGLSLFIGFFSKLTVAMLMGFAGILFLLYIWRHKVPFKLTKVQLGIFILFFIPILYYQIHILLHYHTIMPTLPVTHPEFYLNSHFYIPEEQRNYLTPLEWLERMKNYIYGGWFGIHSHYSITKETLLGFIGLFVLHIVALIALFMKFDKQVNAHVVLGKLTLIALLMVFVIQYIFSYNTHLNTGYLGGVQPRYLLPFLGGFAIMASLFVNKMSQSFWMSIVVIALCIQAIYSDFFYFLLHY